MLSGRSKKEEDRDGSQRLELTSDYERLLYTPAGNTAVLGLAKQAIAQYRLGTDTAPDLLNICLDSPHRIAEAYGPESVEIEDMYYRLDRDLADFLTFVFAQVKDRNVLVVVTSDHGTSPSYDAGEEPAERFNSRQFEVIVNGFLNVRYGTGEWVVAYGDKSLWLNHNLIYERGLDLAEIQNEVAIFAMQFSGVSHALAASAMRTSYFGSGYARKMQNSFYPRRSGDVILNLMPGWIEEQERCWSMSGSMYGYDTEVPLLFYGEGAGPLRVNRRVEMTSVAPTLARVAGVLRAVVSSTRPSVDRVSAARWASPSSAPATGTAPSSNDRAQRNARSFALMVMVTSQKDCPHFSTGGLVLQGRPLLDRPGKNCYTDCIWKGRDLWRSASRRTCGGWIFPWWEAP